MEIYGRLDSSYERSILEKMFLWKVAVEDDYNQESILAYDTLKDNSLSYAPDFVMKHMKTNGLLVLDYRFTTNRDALLKIGVVEDCVVMEFLLNSDAETANNSGLEIQKRNRIGSHNLQYIAKDCRLFYLQRDVHFDAFCIFMSKEFYFTLIGKNNSLHNAFADRIKKDLPTELNDNYLPMNFEMQSVIHKIRNCSRTGSLHRFCLEIKIQELLLLQFEQHHQITNAIKPKKESHERDMESIKLAAQLLEEHYEMPPTIKRLARMIGVNESKLKKSFKSVYEMTIHDYLIKIRMDKANKMIRQQDLQIKEVAMELGYKNPSHFSAAFKKHFGFLPTEMVR